jgi:hypothetical protein
MFYSAQYRQTETLADLFCGLERLMAYQVLQVASTIRRAIGTGRRAGEKKEVLPRVRWRDRFHPQERDRQHRQHWEQTATMFPM